LDEWVLDYPQQVVLTTLNLVLTNEINDILEERQRQREIAEAEGSENEDQGLGDDGDEAGDDDADGKEEGGGEEKSKNANDSQRDLEKRDAGDENPTPAAKKVLKGTAVVKRAAAEERERLLAELFGKDFKADERFRKAMDAAVEDFRQRRNAMAPGSTPSGPATTATKAAKRSTKRPEYRDYVMEVLGQ
jgi:hypothetical protein